MSSPQDGGRPPDSLSVVPLDDIPKTVTAIIDKESTATVPTPGTPAVTIHLDTQEQVSPTNDGLVGKETINKGSVSGASTPTMSPFHKKSSHSKGASSGHVKSKSSTSFIPIIPAAEPVVDHLPGGTGTNDRLRLGICAMDKKARSKPMAEILSRLDATLFHVLFFGDDAIVNQPITEWPVCDVLIAFYSKGYPLEKVRSYVNLRKPFILNDLEMQILLKDRRRVYDLLEASGIDVPRHVFLSKDDYVSTGSGDGNGNRDREVQEFDDHIECNGVVIHKPFVEKPVNADDHNIAIYYPTSAGGGCKKLFRKIGNKSSEFYPDINDVRRDGSYIYEEFVETQGTDVKMYTVGPEYGHAEARKSPTVDGRVQRSSDGKEIRFPVILTLREKEIARRIVLGFKQFVCGFDLLRVQEGHSVVSFVCDVNGFSFVKNSRKYYDDCAQILTEHILAAVKPKSLKGFSTLDPLLKHVYHQEIRSKASSTLSRVARLLQGETMSSLQSPPPSTASSYQEMKETVPDERLRDDNTGNKDEQQGSSPLQADPSAATTLVEGAIPVRDMPDHLTSQPASLCASSVGSQEDLTNVNGNNHNNRSHPKRMDSNETVENDHHQEELRCVIAVVRHGDRTPKQKLKVNMTEPLILKYFHDHSDDGQKELKVKAKAPMTEFLRTVKTIIKLREEEWAEQQSADKTTTEQPNTAPAVTNSAQQDEPKPVVEKKAKKKVLNQLRHMRDVLERWKITGLNRKLQIKPKRFVENDETGRKECVEVQLILKWGGNLTKLGEKASVVLGERLRHLLYPDSPGGGILRLHSTFRHDLKIKTSDEGRVMKTAAAFAKGLLELEGEIPPILVSLVHKEKGSMHMLDPSGDKDAKLELDECKEHITANLQRDIDFREMTEEDREQMVGNKELTAMRDALAVVGNPRKTLMEIHRTMGLLIEQLEEMLDIMGSGDEKRIEGGEGLQGDEEADVALSGVKLYKGETLLELTERWRFIYKRLYDPDEDLFDLSRIPDVHDNVRFDVLHNPHLGLTSTLEKLYELAKGMADCVVPQEYGTTIAEKRSVGVKICSSLLEKIMYDLKVARTDHKADMRYMINMDYSADLPINTMGRRIRTRLYFTSESHLHTMLNVLRFAGEGDGSKIPAILSPEGIYHINNTRELCYLTQIIIRLFEDVSRSMDDPRRFRVEILFSPGATATPLHMDEAIRDADSTRLDTSPLEHVGRGGLTCTELEDYFGAAISEGRKNKGDDLIDVASASTAHSWKKSDYHAHGSVTQKVKHIKIDHRNQSTLQEGLNEDDDIDAPVADMVDGTGMPETSSNMIKTHDANQNQDVSYGNKDGGPATHRNWETTPTEMGKDATDGSLAHKYFWSSIALGTLMLGAGCFVMAISLTGSSSRGRRGWSRR